MRYIFDLDGGVLNTDGFNYQTCSPIKARVDKIRELYSQGNMIIIQISRGLIWEDFTRNQLDLFEIPFHAISHSEQGDVHVVNNSVTPSEFFNQ